MITLSELGNELKDQREEKGLSLEDIAEKIKVSVRILRMIEEGNSKGLPHAVYARGFIVSYASVLDFDKDKLLSDLDMVFPPEDVDEVYPTPITITPSRPMGGFIRRFAAIFVLLAIVAAIAGGGWFLYNKYGESLSDLVKQPFSAVSTPNEEQTDSNVQNEAIEAKPIISQEAPPAPIIEASNESENEELSKLNATAANQAALSTLSEDDDLAEEESEVLSENTASENEAIEADNKKVAQNTLLIQSRARCWLRVESDKKIPREFTTTPGEDTEIVYNDKLKIILGNPSGVSLKLNGKEYTGNLNQNSPITLEFPL